MKAPWTVELAGSEGNRASARAYYGQDYFPRKFAYKKEAYQLAKELKAKSISHQILDKASNVRDVYLAT